MYMTFHGEVLVRFAGKVWRYRGPVQRQDGTMTKRTSGGRSYPGYSVLENPVTSQIARARNDMIQVK